VGRRGRSRQCRPALGLGLPCRRQGDGAGHDDDDCGRNGQQPASDPRRGRRPGLATPRTAAPAPRRSRRCQRSGLGRRSRRGSRSRPHSGRGSRSRQHSGLRQGSRHSWRPRHGRRFRQRQSPRLSARGSHHRPGQPVRTRPEGAELGQQPTRGRPVAWLLGQAAADQRPQFARQVAEFRGAVDQPVHQRGARPGAERPLPCTREGQHRTETEDVTRWPRIIT